MAYLTRSVNPGVGPAGDGEKRPVDPQHGRKRLSEHTLNRAPTRLVGPS